MIVRAKDVTLGIEALARQRRS